MNGVLIDSCVLLDLFSNDDNWGNWSENILEHYSVFWSNGTGHFNKR